MAEGVGFEPTVSCPTFDFESSALNRAQPPFRFIINKLSMLQNLESAVSTVQHHAWREKRTVMEPSAPKQLVWISTEVQFLCRHKTGRYYVRTCAGGKQKWTSLKTTLLAVLKSGFRSIWGPPSV